MIIEKGCFPVKHGFWVVRTWISSATPIFRMFFNVLHKHEFPNVFWKKGPVSKSRVGFLARLVPVYYLNFKDSQK